MSPPERQTERPKLHLEINPGRLAEIVGAAVFASTEIVNLHLNSLSDENLRRPIAGGGIVYQFKGPDLSLDQRRAMHENWILSRAIQELLRAVRHALEEAHVITALLTAKHQIRSNDTLANFLKPLKSKAAGLRFPDLLAAVNNLLNPKLEFADSYKSLQAARNCLEHRAGIVGEIDTKGGPEFKLSVPRVKIFYMRGGEQIELAAGERVEPGDDRAEVDILMRIEIRKRAVLLGHRLTFTPAEFNEIAFACNHFGQVLAAGLPKPKIEAAAP